MTPSHEQIIDEIKEKIRCNIRAYEFYDCIEIEGIPEAAQAAFAVVERYLPMPQSMKTAPKDGERILAYFPREGMWLTVRYTSYNDWEIEPDGAYDFAYDISGDPTHWMPLPTGPVEVDSE